MTIHLSHYAVSPSRPTMVWGMYPQKHTLKNVFHAIELHGRFEQVVRGCDMIEVTAEVAAAIANNNASFNKNLSL